MSLWWTCRLGVPPPGLAGLVLLAGDGLCGGRSGQALDEAAWLPPHTAQQRTLEAHSDALWFPAHFLHRGWAASGHCGDAWFHLWQQ